MTLPLWCSGDVKSANGQFNGRPGFLTSGFVFEYSSEVFTYFCFVFGRVCFAEAVELIGIATF